MTPPKQLGIAVLGALLLAGCSATSPVYQAAPAPEGGSVLVYLPAEPVCDGGTRRPLLC